MYCHIQSIKDTSPLSPLPCVTCANNEVSRKARKANQNTFDIVGIFFQDLRAVLYGLRIPLQFNVHESSVVVGSNGGTQ